MSWFLKKLIRFYQKLISPLLPSTCRFYPSCSEYMYQSLTKYGLLRGLRFGIRRLLKCHPYHQGGFDPVDKE